MTTMMQMHRTLRNLGRLGISNKTNYGLRHSILCASNQHPYFNHRNPQCQSDEVRFKIFNRYLTHQEQSRARIDTINVNQTKVLTIPNILTFSRICITPAVGYFIWNGMHSSALACFAFAAATDLLDGLIARHFNQKSDVGGLLDPIADKLLLTTSLIALCSTDVIPMWFARGVIYRDITLITGATLLRYFGFRKSPSLKQFFDFKNYPSRGLEPTITSKCNTALLCVVIALHLSTNHMAGIPSYDYAMFALHLVNAFLATMSLAQYTIRLGN